LAFWVLCSPVRRNRTKSGQAIWSYGRRRPTPTRRGTPTLAARWPWLVAFCFGLQHGFGFAGALAGVGSPHHAIPVALLFFKLGVEIGQLVFVAAVMMAGGLFRRATALRLEPALVQQTVNWLDVIAAYAMAQSLPIGCSRGPLLLSYEVGQVARLRRVAAFATAQEVTNWDSDFRFLAPCGKFRQRNNFDGYPGVATNMLSGCTRYPPLTHFCRS
jgi:hypothetical protein